MVINADEVCYSDGFIRLKMQEQLDDDDAIDAVVIDWRRISILHLWLCVSSRVFRLES